MNDELSLTVERVRQNLTARRALLRDLASQTTADARLGGRMFLAGDRVFDVSTGREGVVYATKSASSTDPTTVSVQFSSLEFGWRKPDQLILRPTPPAPREVGQ